MFRRARSYIYLGAIFSFLAMSGSANSGDLTLTESISGGFRYDNNVRVQPEGQVSDEDFVTVISPQLQLASEHERIQLTGAYALSASFYFANPDLNNLAHSVNAGINMTLSPSTSLSFNDRIGYSRDSLEATLTGIQRERTSTLSNAFSVGFAHAFTARTSGSISLSDTMYRYESAAATTTTRTDSASVGIGFTATQRTSLFASYGFTNINYDTSTGVNNFLIHSLQAGFGYQISPSIQLNLSGGTVYTPTIATSRTDWIASGAITKSFERSSLNFGYVRNMTDTSGLVSELNIHDTYTLGVGHKLTDKVDIALEGNYSTNRTTPSSTLDLESYSAGISGSWRPYSWMTVSLGYNHFEQVSHGIIGSDFKRDNIFLNFTATRSRRL